MEPFCEGGKTQVALINAVQVHCYEDTRIMKAFPQILKVLYSKDCVSDQAIIYWYQKGSKPQGRQHFLKITEPLVKVRSTGIHSQSRANQTWYKYSFYKSRKAMTRTSNSIIQYTDYFIPCLHRMLRFEL